MSAESAQDGGVLAASPLLFPLEGHVFYLFSQILGRRNRALNTDLRRFGLDYSRWRVLAVLNANPGCSMHLLSEQTSVDRTTLVPTVRTMEREGLLLRQERETDRRSVSLTLTVQGRAMLAQILPVVLAQTDRALAGMTAADKAKLHQLLIRIVANLKA